MPPLSSVTHGDTYLTLDQSRKAAHAQWEAIEASQRKHGKNNAMAVPTQSDPTPRRS